MNHVKLIKFATILLLSLLCFSSVYAQGDVPIPPNEPIGDPDWNFRGVMNGNRIFESFRNHGEIGFWNTQRQAQDDSDWPAGGEANPYSDGIAIVVGGSVLDNTGQRVAMVSAHFREEVDRSPDLETIWGWHPVPGYLNFNRTPNPIPAKSNDESSWPSGGWPDQPTYIDADGNTEWNGRFGRGKFNAQLEAYYIMDDGVDYEFDYTPDPTNTDRGGLGMRVATRHYQWVHPLAQDAIFGEFTITNISDKDVDSTGFGWYVDNGIGGSGSDNATFVVADGGIRDLDLAVAFDPLGEVGIWGGPSGLAGYAFLESPGIPTDGIDNDLDGILDERRDNDAGFFVDDPLTGPNGTPIDANLFNIWYGRDPAPHWEGDEDHDWLGFSDDNGSGVWEDPEAVNDDVGTDGVGPDDLNYFGPDPDGTEANGRPDQGEPNFGRTDNDESDQLGMTFFEMRPIAGHPNPQPNRFQPLWFSDDDAWWGWLSGDSIVPTPVTEQNLAMVFASGTFPLESQRTERFSMLVSRSFGNELDFSEMIDLKDIVQAIFNTDYQFTQPPIKPTLTAVPGDGKVTLFWNRVSELSKDPFLGRNVQDFSGYRIYRATDPLFQEITIITDENGSPILKKPLQIFDLEDDYKGPHPILVNGAPFDMGNETGLVYNYTDNNVLNGVTYYYAIAAYDTGSISRGLSPTENTTIIEVNNIGLVQFTDRNTTAVTPRAAAAGYQPPTYAGDITSLAEGVGSGFISDIQFIAPAAIEQGTKYRIYFDNGVESRTRNLFTTEYRIEKEAADGTVSDLLPTTPWVPDSTGLLETELLDGMIITIQNVEAEINQDRSGWVDGDGVTTVKNGLAAMVRPDSGRTLQRFSFDDIELRFADGNITESVRGRGAGNWLNGVDVPFEVVVPVDSTVLSVSLDDLNSNGVFELEKDGIQIWENVEGRRQAYYFVTFAPTAADSSFTQPGAGDVVRIVSLKEFTNGDFFEFQTNAESVDSDAAARDLEANKVAAVPNPFIFTSPLDPNVPTGFTQESRLMFINCPARATIRIFTLSGKLVDTIETDNNANDGRAMWDLRSNEALNIAPGIYIFHVTDKASGAEQIGRFAIIR